MTDPGLKASLQSVEQLAAQGRFAHAATGILGTVESAAGAANVELLAPDAAQGSLGFQLAVARIDYLGTASRWQDGSIPAQIQATLAKHIDDARGKRWPFYLTLCRQLITSYNILRDINGVYSAYQTLLAYDPVNEESMGAYVRWCVGQGKKLDGRAILQQIQQYESAGGTLTPEIAMAKIKIQENVDAQADVFPAGLNWLQTYPGASPDLVREAVDFVRLRLDASRPDRIREFYQTLTVLAIKQPGDDDRVGLTAHILNERKKLEAIMPGVKQ